jgi:hypothetical protein
VHYKIKNFICHHPGCRRAFHLESHYLEHMEECFEVIRDRVLAGDVHKDDYSGEYVLKDYVGECTAKYGALDERTLRGQRAYGEFLRRLGRLEEAKVLLLAARKVVFLIKPALALRHYFLLEQ